MVVAIRGGARPPWASSGDRAPLALLPYGKFTMFDGTVDVPARGAGGHDPKPSQADRSRD
ncbi:hypothetical protein ACWGCP_41150 [Streptomyces niveus]